MLVINCKDLVESVQNEEILRKKVQGKRTPS